MKNQVFYLFVMIQCILCILYIVPNRISKDCNNNFATTLSLKPVENKMDSSSILARTFKFMIDKVSEDDPELVSFVKSLIKYPNNFVQRNLKEVRNSYSQEGQDLYIDTLLNNKKNGFFVEAGGHDGEEYSNTLFFELYRNWTGLLIEAIPRSYELLVNKSRNILSINACLSSKEPHIAKFIIGGSGSTQLDNLVFEALDANSAFVYVPCFSINTILKAIDVSNVDYFSLDIEGGEWDVMKDIRLDKLNIKMWSIETNKNETHTQWITNKLIANNYTLIKRNSLDSFFLKKEN